MALPASAQDSEPSEVYAGDIEEIVVVGSLIKRPVVHEGRAPVQTLDSELFESVGAAQAVDILPNLTANTGSTIATQQSYMQGVSQFSLRGVGLSSTLTLINGRRAGFAPVSNDVGQSFFDINTLPVLLIERVEILRDGASATYGSQAVAGVANIVTRRGFSGLEFTGGYRSASNTAYDAGFAAGFETPRGYVSLYGSGLKQDENFRTDFAWMTPRAIDPDGDGDIVEGSFDSGRGSPGSFRRAVANPDGTYSPFQIDGFDTPRFPDPDCRAGGGYPSGSLCRMDFSDQRTMIAAEERFQFFVDAEFALTDTITLVAEVAHSVNEVTDRVGNMLLFNGNVERTNEFFVPANHPFNFWTDPDGDGVLTWITPSEWMPEVHEAVPVGYFGRPLGAEAFGDNSGYDIRDFDNLRAMVGFDADLPGGWAATGHLARARSDLAVNADRHWIAAEFAAVIAEGLWNPFGTRLVSPDLLTPKTVANDGVAPALASKRAGNDAATLARFESTRMEHAQSAQDVAEFMVSGDLFEWRDQPVALAAGAQYRELDYSFQPDPLNMAGAGPRDVREYSVAADQRVWAVFAETLTQFERAEVQLAVRHEEYDKAGGSTDPKIAAQFFVNERLSLRASWGTSFQAPSVFQAAGNDSSRTITDPFRFDGQGVGQCTVDASGTIVNRGDNFALSTFLRGGNLGPQTAASANLGLLLEPWTGSAVSLDYWTLDYRNVIAQGRSFQAIVDDDCLDDGRPNDPRVLRDSSGQLSLVTTEYENVGAVRTEGFDFNSHYDFPPASIGDFRITADATLLTRFDVRFSDEGFSDQLGNRNDRNGFAPTPELRVNLGLNWRTGPHTAGITLRYVDGYKNDEIPTHPKIASWTTLDANYSYRIANLFGTQTTIFLGTRNLTDKAPPPLPTGLEGIQRHNLRPGYDGLVHDIKGRTIYLRFRVSTDA